MKHTICLAVASLVIVFAVAFASNIVGPPNDPFDLSKLPPNAGLSTTGLLIGETVSISQLDRSKFPVIEMYVDVLDDEGVPIGGLTAADFCVAQDDEPVGFQVTEVGSQGCPISVCLVIDRSGSMLYDIQYAKDAAKQFVNNMDSFDRVAVAAFSSCVETIHAFSSDKVSLCNAIDGITATGMTAAHDGMWLGLDLAAPELGSKAVIGFTDGYENYSDLCWPPPMGLYYGYPDPYGPYEYDSIIICDKANAAGIPIYSIGVNTGAYMDAFCAFSAATGGYCITGATAEEIDSIYTEIKGRLCSRYFITFTSPDVVQDGDLHAVEVCIDAPTCAPCDTAYYWEELAPAILPDPATEALSLHCQMPYLDIPICATVIDTVPPQLQTVTLFYRISGTAIYSSVTMTSAGGDLYCYTLPGSMFPVNTPGLDYYITASDGVQTVSYPEFNPQHYPKVITICPNEPPVIVHNPPSCNLNNDIDVYADVQDPLDWVARVMLYYRKSTEILYDSSAMLLGSGSTYMGTIPASYSTADGVDYMIRAWDNYGVMAAVGPFTLCEGGGCCQLPGDVNHDNKVDIADFQYLRDYLHRAGPEPPCFEEADVNGDGEITQQDMSCMARYLYSDGNPCVFVECPQ